MKKVLVVILTMLIETVLLWAVSIFIGWDFMETIFLGGLLIFAIPWLYLFFSNHEQNVYNANVKGMTGADIGGVKLFQFRFSPIIIGLVLFMIISLFLTIYYYYDYFI
ncbi:hypothetical protein [Sporosarcina sp. D27]|uniref:hypothetical protein n=1 Tax=Sporosarcina sp. D27 TaxID=1382305 RepID=UPI00047139C5|nr:hypothetical protein [Sporosarcina sp. D27]